MGRGRRRAGRRERRRGEKERETRRGGMSSVGGSADRNANWEPHVGTSVEIG